MAFPAPNHAPFEALDRSGERPSALAPRTSILRTKQGPPSFAAKVDCMGVPVALGSWLEVRDWFFASAQTRGRAPKVLYFATTHACNLAWKDPELRAVLSRADVVLDDGVGLGVYARLAGIRFAQRLDADVLVSHLLSCATAKRELRVFLYGGAKGRADRAARAIEARFPHVRVVGALDGEERGESVLESINEACADVLLAGMGAPVQERWIDEHRDLLDVGIVAGVGALIDSLAGERTRASRWTRALELVAFVARSVAYLGLGIGPTPTRAA